MKRGGPEKRVRRSLYGFLRIVSVRLVDELWKCRKGFERILNRMIWGGCGCVRSRVVNISPRGPMEVVKYSFVEVLMLIMVSN